MQTTTQTTRSPEEILKDMNRTETTSIVRIPLGNFKRPRRTCAKPYISEYKGNAIMTIPYGTENFEFSFSVRKGLALYGMMNAGTFQKLLLAAVDKQKEIDARKPKVTDIIDLG